MARFRTEALSGWARYPVEEARVYRPESTAQAAEALRSAGEQSWIPRGLGRSYGDAALNSNGAVLLGVKLNRFLDFDAASGVVECEAGVTIDDLLRALLFRGFFPAVTPGTRFVTVGGAVAADVHGKNHPRAGSFARHLESLRLLLPSGEVLVCSRTENADAFHATTGGMGLTGVILSTRMRLRRVETAWMTVGVRRAPDLDHAMDAMEGGGEPEYRVAWIDCLARGPSLGRAVVQHGDHAPAAALDHRSRDPLTPDLGASRRIPTGLASGLMWRPVVRAFNAAYYAASRAAQGRLVDVGSFFYPLDAVRDWNGFYGRQGFAQYQFVLPAEVARKGLKAVLMRLSSSLHPGYLAVLKRMGPEGDGPLSFPREGWTLAVDIPRAPGLAELLRMLDRVVQDHGGRVYLAKDAHLDASTFAAFYPHADRFREIKRRLDPDTRLSSSLARRVGLVAG